MLALWRLQIAFGVAAAVVTAAVFAASGAWGASGGEKREATPAVAVAMGDSFISGEGGRWLGNSQNPLGNRDGTDRAAVGCTRLQLRCARDPRRIYGATQDNGCHRSDVAPILSAFGSRGVNLACSGAQTKHLWRAARGGAWFKGEPPQADQLARIASRRRVGLVVLTAIANDLGFRDHVTDCTLAWATSLPARPERCGPTEQAEVRAGLPAARAGLTKAVREIRAVLAAAGQDRGSYRLMIMGYASPIPPGALMRYPEWGWKRLTRGGCPFWDADADWANRGITPTMVRAMRAVAAAEGAEFLDVQRALDGHQVCDRRAGEVGPKGPSAVTAEWARRLIPYCCQGSVQESLHPNAYGQRALGRCIALAWAEAADPGGEWTCSATPGRGIAGVRIADPNKVTASRGLGR